MGTTATYALTMSRLVVEFTGSSPLLVGALVTGAPAVKETTTMPRETRSLEELEAIVDQFDMGQVMVMLADICTLKAEHIRENWQDEPLARAWEQAHNYLYNVSQVAPIKAISRQVVRS